MSITSKLAMNLLVVEKVQPWIFSGRGGENAAQLSILAQIKESGICLG